MPGKEDDKLHRSAVPRYAQSMRVERSNHINLPAGLKSQSISAAVSRSRSCLVHPSPAELERKHSHVRRKSTGLFSSKPLLKVPRIDNAVNLFLRLQATLSDSIKFLHDALNTIEPKRKRFVEHRIRMLDSRLVEIEELLQLYLYEQKIREGAKNLMNALIAQGSKEGQDKCRASYKECTERMCALEQELESKLGVFKVKLNGLAGFGRLCSGDVYDVHLRHGTNLKWKSRCKVEKEGQKWIDEEFTMMPSIQDELMIRVIEMKKIQANVPVGSILLRSRNYIKALHQSFAVPLNSTGSLKLLISVEWRPFSGKEEVSSLQSKRQSLLSEVIFVPASSTKSSSSSDLSSSQSQTLSEGPECSPSQTVVPLKNIGDEGNLDSDQTRQLQVSSEKSSDQLDSGYCGAQEDVQEFRHATSLDRALEHLIPTLHTYKDQHPELLLLLKQLERLDELLKVIETAVISWQSQSNTQHKRLIQRVIHRDINSRGEISKSDVSLSVESALESFDFLDDDFAGDSCSTIASNYSGASGHSRHDTGYNSTDEVQTRDNLSPLCSILRQNGPVCESLEECEESTSQHLKESLQALEERIVRGDETNGDTASHRGSCASTSTVKSDRDDTTHLDTPSGNDGTVPQDIIGVPPGDDTAASVSVVSFEEGAAGCDPLSPARSASPPLSSVCSQEATVGNTILDKVILCHLQLCEELLQYLGAFGPMKLKEIDSLHKLRQQTEVLERLILLVTSDSVDLSSLRAVCPRLTSNSSLTSFWQMCCNGNPVLFISSKTFSSTLKAEFDNHVKQNYNRVVSQVFPTIISRVIHQDNDLLHCNFTQNEIITVFQFEHFFIDNARYHLAKYVDEVGYELLINKRLLSNEKDAVMAQLKQYAEIPLIKTCFFSVLTLLVGQDCHLIQASEAFLLNLMRDQESRKKAIELSCEALEDPEEKIREGACAALTVLQGKDAIAQLLYLSRCDVPTVKLAARKALSSFGQDGAEAVKQSTFSSSEIEGLLF